MCHYTMPRPLGAFVQPERAFMLRYGRPRRGLSERLLSYAVPPGSLFSSLPAWAGGAPLPLARMRMGRGGRLVIDRCREEDAATADTEELGQRSERAQYVAVAS